MTSERPHRAATGTVAGLRRVRRRTADRVIGGVAGGVADYFDIDPLLVRVAFAGLMIFGGAGLVLYVISWLVIPANGRDQSIVQELFGRLSNRIGARTAIVAVVVVALGLLWLVGQTQTCTVTLVDVNTSDPVALEEMANSPYAYTEQCVGGWSWLGGIEPVTLRDAAVMAILVIGVGVVILRRREGSGPGRPPANLTETLSTRAADTDMDVTPGSAAALAPWTGDAQALTARPGAQPRSPLGWYVLAAALMVLGLLAIVANLPGVRVGLGQYFGAALTAIGLGLVVATWWGRARLLIALGLLVLPIGMTAAFINVPIDGGFGEQMFHPRTVGELRPDYRLTGGEIYLDLTDLASTEPIALTASVGVGRLVVVVPRGARLVLDAGVSGGRLTLFGGRQVGTGLADRVERLDGPGPQIRLTLKAGIGEVLVDTAQGG